MSIDSFLSLYKTIQKDYQEIRLVILNDNNYCDVINEDLNNVDRKNLQILIFFDDFNDMKETIKIPKEKV